MVVFAIEHYAGKEQREVIEQRDLHENLFYPVGSVDCKCCCGQGNANCGSDDMDAPKLTEEEKTSHKHIENHLYDHRPVRSFQIRDSKVILKHGEVTQQCNGWSVDGVFLCVMEMDADDGKREQYTHPIGRVEAREAIDNECAQTIGLLKTHEDDKSAYDEKQIDTRCPEAEYLFITLVVQGEVKENHRQSSYAAKSVEWTKPGNGRGGC